MTTLPSKSRWTSWARYPWISDQGDGTYRNPILYADYSDPDVIRHGDDFYMTASSFNCTPGLPILHSRDMVNWTLINHAVRELPHARFSAVQPGQGIWAPAIRLHAGKFHIFFAMPDEGIYLTTTTDPAGVWSVPHLVVEGKGLIDPCPLWDDDGKAYLVHAYAGSRAGIKHRLRVRPMAPDGSRLLGEGEIVFHEPERHPTLEGPKFLKKDGWYYILAPAGGVTTGWQLALRSRHIYGPYQDRIVMTQGATPINGPHQGALVDLPNGEWWFFHFQAVVPYGRIVHLQPVAWSDGWPLMGSRLAGEESGTPVPVHRKPEVGMTSPISVPQTSDEFEGPKLGLQWQWQSNHRKEWYSLSARPGWLRLFSDSSGEGDLARTGHLLLQKLPAASFFVETKLDFFSESADQMAGLVVMGNEHAALALRKNTHKGKACRIVYLVNNIEQAIYEVDSPQAILRVHVGEGGICVFSFVRPGGKEEFVPKSFLAREGEWIGAKIGLFTFSPTAGQACHADFDYFRFF